MFSYLKEKLIDYGKNAFEGAKVSSIAFIYFAQHTTYWTFLFSYIVAFTTPFALFMASIYSFKAIPFNIALLAFFAMLIITMFCIQVIHTATILFTRALFAQQPLSFLQSIKEGLKKWKPLLLWSAVMFAIKLLTSKKNDSSTLSARISTGFFWFLNLSWDTVTFFMLPLIATTDKGLWQSMKDSYTITKTEFGKLSGGIFGIHFINIALTRIIILAMIIITFVVTSFFLPEETSHIIHAFKAAFLQNKNLAYEHLQKLSQSGINILIGLSLFAGIFAWFMLYVFKAVIKSIFKTALYNYTINQPTGPFSEALIKKEAKL